MKGKKFIPVIKAMKTIDGIVEKGGIYKLYEMMSLFPYVDFKNTDFFQPVYTDDVFKTGDIVKYIGKTTFLGPKDKLCTYVVSDVGHKIIDSRLYTTYSIVKRYGGDGSKWIVNEDELEIADSKWIISFSNEMRQNAPAVHELDYFAAEKIGKTWKSLFVFESKDEAEKAAELLATYGFKKMCKNMKDNGKL